MLLCPRLIEYIITIIFPGNISKIIMNEHSTFLIETAYLYLKWNELNLFLILKCSFSVAEYITSFISKWENHSSKAVTESKSKGMP